jgi:serine protease Do
MEFLRRQIQQRPVQSLGSGFIVSPDGHIITNRHVIAGATRILVKLDSGEEYVARSLGDDEETDIAVLKIDAKSPLPAVRLGDSGSVKVGDWVLAIGSPFGLAKTVTAGIISQTRRETPLSTPFQRFIQTDAAINRGNSGGPLVNLRGEVIGVNSQIATSTGDFNGVSFALPSDETRHVYEQILKNGKVRRGYLGVLLDSIRPEFIAVYGLKETGGAIITDIRDKDGPAAKAGVMAGDIVVEFNGQPIAGAQDLITKVAMTAPERTVELRILREIGDELVSKTINVTLGERPTQSSNAGNNDRRRMPVNGDTDDDRPFGMTLAELTPALAAANRLDGLKGLLIEEISPSSFISDVKNTGGGDALNPGDLIQRMNRKTVTTLASFKEMVSNLKPGDPVVLHVAFYNPATRSVQTKLVQFTVR